MQEKGFPGWQATIPIAATVLILMAGKDGILNRWVLSNKVLVWFGLISYPMYLWHWPLISMKRIVSMEAPKPLYCAGAFVASTILAWLTTKLIENPLRFGEYGKAKTVALFLVMVVVGFCGYRAFKTKGFPKRSLALVQIAALHEILVKNHHTNTGYYDASGKRNPCHSFEEESDFKECRHIEGNTFDSNKKTIAIWGDSHAAHLMPGLRHFYGNRYNIMERTGGGCPAMGNPGKPQCQKNTSLIVKDILSAKPWQVILAARWDAYHEDVNRLKEVVQQLRENNISNIVLIGNAPVYKNPLPKEIIKFYIRNNKYPEHIKEVEPFSKATDEKMAALAKEMDIPYYSTYRLLCSEKGCIGMAENNPEKVLAFDEAHLTEAGSVYLVGRLKNELGLNRIK